MPQLLLRDVCQCSVLPTPSDENIATLMAASFAQGSRFACAGSKSTSASMEKAHVAHAIAYSRSCQFNSKCDQSCLTKTS